MWPTTVAGSGGGGDNGAGEMSGERRKDPETVEFGGWGDGPAVHD